MEKTTINLQQGKKKIKFEEDNNFIKQRVYWTIDEDGKKIFDEECMRDEFEEKLNMIKERELKNDAS